MAGGCSGSPKQMLKAGTAVGGLWTSLGSYGGKPCGNDEELLHHQKLGWLGLRQRGCDERLLGPQKSAGRKQTKLFSCKHLPHFIQRERGPEGGGVSTEAESGPTEGVPRPCRDPREYA